MSEHLRTEELRKAQRALDARVAEQVLGLTVLETWCVAAYVEGEWSLHPESEPGGWACYAGYEPVYVEHCICAVFAPEFDLKPDPGLDIDPEFIEEVNRMRREEFEADRQRWGHSRTCLAVVPEYSRDMTAAWAVIEKWAGESRLVEIDNGGWPEGQYRVAIDQKVLINATDKQGAVGYGPTVSMAICAAALKLK